MAKTIIKEIIVMLLLCIAILLILGILFYEYIPTNKTIPAKETYQTPENVKEEINEKITKLEKTEVSYEITDSDLNIYKQSKSYKPGKKNPFALEETTVQGEGTNATNTGSSSGSTSSGTTTEEPEEPKKDEDSTGTFFNDEGIK